MIPVPAGGDRAGPPRDLGFTLIELLVTLFVVAVLSGVAVIRLGSSDQTLVLEREAQRLRQTMQLARDRALISGEQWALEIGAQRYAFLRLDRDSGTWEPVDARPFGRHELPDDLSLRLRTEGRHRAGASDAGALMRRDGSRRPDLVFLSSGEMTPFRLSLVGPGDLRPVRLTGDGFSQVRFAPEEA